MVIFFILYGMREMSPYSRELCSFFWVQRRYFLFSLSSFLLIVNICSFYNVEVCTTETNSKLKLVNQKENYFFLKQRFLEELGLCYEVYCALIEYMPCRFLSKIFDKGLHQLSSQWSRLHASNAGGTGSIPAGELRTHIPFGIAKNKQANKSSDLICKKKMTS